MNVFCTYIFGPCVYWVGYCKTSDFFLVNISSTFPIIIDHFEIPTFLINEQEPRWILEVSNAIPINAI